MLVDSSSGQPAPPPGMLCLNFNAICTLFGTYILFC